MCDSPERSAAAAVGGGIAGGVAGLALGLDTVAVALLAGALAGGADTAAHLLRWRRGRVAAAADRLRTAVRGA